MFIAIINEPRSVSTNLITWFTKYDNFTVWIMPSFFNSNDYKNGINPRDYSYETEHLIIKEDFFAGCNFDDLISAADKIIVLYRENGLEQAESWLTAAKTNNFNSFYKFEKDNSDWAKNEINKFMILKQAYAENFLVHNDFLKITYEDLYYRNQFKKILDYLDIQELKNVNFPLGEKCRIFDDNKKIPNRMPKKIFKFI